MSTLNINDLKLADDLIKEIENKKLPVDRSEEEGTVLVQYRNPMQRPKVFFRKQVIGRINSIKMPSIVEFQIDHPRGINMFFSKDKKDIKIGR